MNQVLIFSCAAALVLFAFVRPHWRQIGPSLLDSFVTGLLLFAVGSVVVWFEGAAHSEAIMRIGVSAALSGLLGASLWGWVFRRRTAELHFFTDARGFTADPADRFVISAGFVVSSLASSILLIAVFRHEHIRSLLLGALLHGTGTFNEARMIVSSGSEGYFAPGYVKQFRDIIVPILCAAAILCRGTYRPLSLLFAALLIAIAATFISGQRLVIIQYVLCLGTTVLITMFLMRQHIKSLFIGAGLLLVLLAGVGVMTKLLGRMELPPSASTTEAANLPNAIRLPLLLAERAVVVVPRENALTYPVWAEKRHAPGAGWFKDLAGIRPGTQAQTSSELSGAVGDSPLGLATDVFYSWSWIGVLIVPPLFALAFLWLDIALVTSRSALTSAAKIFLFFAIPTMYSPYMFILYGGVVAIGILCYVRLRQRDAFSFIGIRPRAQ